MTFPKVPPTVLLLLVSAALGCVLFVVLIFFSASQSPAQAQASSYPAPLSLNPDAIAAKAAIVYDPTDGRILFQKNASTSLPLASLTKLMSATVVLSNTQQPLNTPITVTPQDLATDGDAGDWGFHAGDVVALGDLIKFGLVASSNDAMAAAAASLGANYLNDMNRTANTLGLSNTYFLNPTGLDLNSDTSGAYGSALDVARLATSFMKNYPQFFELTSQPTITIEDNDQPLTANATAIPLQDIPGFIGAKTGYTDLAGGNLVAAFDVDINHPLIAVVLGSTQDGRFSDIRTLIAAAQNTP